MSQDYYKTLGVDKSASQDQIKKAYRSLAHQYHPDKKGGDEAKFKEINQAYQVLGDEAKRKQYDQFGAGFENMGGFGQGGFGGASGFNWQDFAGGRAQGVNFEDLGDIFGDMFGGGFGRGRSRVQHGADIEMDLRLSFKEAAFGITKDLEVYKQILCDRCEGDGGEPGAEVKTCETCKGSGQVVRVQRTMLGNIQTAAVCSDCRGQGKVHAKKCTQCGGDGRVKKNTKIKVEVPGGIEDGMTIKLNGQGEAAPFGGPSGDLYLKVHVEKDSILERRGADIHSTVTIPFSTAVLGDKIDVMTIDGEVRLKIPEGTDSGKAFILKGKGAQLFQRSGRGDHIVTVQVETPKKLTKEQKKLVKELGDHGL